MFQRSMLFVLLFPIAAGLNGCQQRATGPQPPAAVVAMEKNNVSRLSDDDAEVNRAIAKARKTMPLFLKVLSKPTSHQTEFGVIKRCYNENGSSEDLWLKKPE